MLFKQHDFLLKKGNSRVFWDDNYFMATIELKGGPVISKEEFDVPAAPQAGQTQSPSSVDLYVPKASVEASIPTTIARPRWGSSIWASPYVGFEGGASGAQTASGQVFAAEATTGRIGSDFIYQGRDAEYGSGVYGGVGGFVQGTYQSTRFEDATTGETSTGKDWQLGAGLRGIAGYHTEDMGSGYWMVEGAAGMVNQIGTTEQNQSFFAGARVGHSF